MAVQPPKNESRWGSYEPEVPLPDDWPQQRRETIAAAGGRCQRTVKTVSGSFRRCPQPGTQVDHVIPRSQGGIDGPRELLCDRHHAIKTAAESAEARRRIAAKLKHPQPGKHPGML